MYLNHYGLSAKPFSLSPDSKFLWLSEKHKEALATLEYGILGEKGFLILTGDVGTGKTVLISALIEQINMDVQVARIADPDLEPLDFFKSFKGVQEDDLSLKTTSKSQPQVVWC